LVKYDPTTRFGIGSPPRLADLDLLVFDFDGVLTDNRVYVSADGTESVVCTRADGWGLDLLRETPLKMAIISTEANPVVAARANKLRLRVLQGVGNKREALTRLAAEYGVTLARTGFVGNDNNDLSALESAGWSICRSDAHERVRAIARWILPRRGGRCAPYC
jgi:YrbI family 3-deoxy-D-manno-octulosonate 8-phosphate phosphatase